MSVDGGEASGQARGRETPPTAAQLGLLLAALPGVRVEPPDWRAQGRVDYVCRESTVLVRDADAERVRDTVGGRWADDPEADAPLTRAHPAGSDPRGNRPVRGRRVAGHRVLEVDGDLAERLALADRVIGPGRATPDHVLWVTPAIGRYCPATEPAVPPATVAAPSPLEPSRRIPLPGLGGRRPRRPVDGTGVRVSVVDTGWSPPAALEHAWLADVTGDEEPTLDAAGNLLPYAGHGTFAAGVVRAVAPGCELRVEGLLVSAGAAFESDVARELTEALLWSPDIVSVQAGTYTRDDHPLLAFDGFVDLLRRRKGTVVLAAAGNDGDVRPFWPAAAPWTTSVGALTADGTARTDYSNHGPWVDVYAVGDDHVNAFLHGTYLTVEPQTPAGELRTFSGSAVWSGTSFATPLVAGMVAERMSRTGAKAPRALADVLEQALSDALPGVGPAALL